MSRHFLLEHWRIREPDKRLKAGRLCAADWWGMTMCHISDYELASVRRFLRGLKKEEVALMKVTTFDDDDYILREVSVWLRREDDWQALDAFLKGLPPRSAQIAVSDTALIEDLHKTLKGINYSLHFNGWPDDTVITVEEERAPMVKLLVG